MKEFFLTKTDLSVNCVYYKSRIYCKLAGYYDYKCVELLTKAFELALQIETPVLRFQVIESIFTTAIYKMSKEEGLERDRRNLIKSIPIELAKIVNDINDDYDKVIGLTRLALFSSTTSNDRHRYLKLSIETIEKVNNDYDKIELISRLSPLICLYDDLNEYLNKAIIEGIKDEKCRLYVKGKYGKILIDGESDFIEKAKQNQHSLHQFTIIIEDDEEEKEEKEEKEEEDYKMEALKKYSEIKGVFTLYALLNDALLTLNNKDISHK